MTLKEARELVGELREMEILQNSVSVAAILLDDQLAKCQANKDRAHMGAAEKLAEISAYKGRAKELEECLKKLLEQCEYADEIGDLSRDVQGDTMFKARQILEEKK